MSEEYLITRKTALLSRLNETDPNIEKTIEQLARTNQAIGAEGGGAESVDIVTGSISDDIRIIDTPGTYAFNNYFYLYITVVDGEGDTVALTGSSGVGVPLKTDEFINLESIAGRKHGNISLTIASGGIVRIIGGY